MKMDFDTIKADTLDAHDELFQPLCAFDYALGTAFESKNDGFSIELKCRLSEDCPCEFYGAQQPWYTGCC